VCRRAAELRWATSNALLPHMPWLQIALQLPDHLLRHGPWLASTLQRALTAGAATASPPPFVAVLGDTSYGSCCVDEVAAAHMAADCIVHYGHACMSAPATLPVYYVFPPAPVDTGAAASAVLHALASVDASLRATPSACGIAPADADRVLLLWEPAAHHAISRLLATLQAVRRPPRLSPHRPPRRHRQRGRRRPDLCSCRCRRRSPAALSHHRRATMWQAAAKARQGAHARQPRRPRRDRRWLCSR